MRNVTFDVGGVAFDWNPDREIFKYLLDRFDLAPAETVFVDDHQPNIDAAQEIGLHTVLFLDSQCTLPHRHARTALIENQARNSSGSRKQGASMATQTELSTQPKSAKANAEYQIPQKAHPEIISVAVTKVSRQGGAPLTREQRHELIAVAAYYLAQGRNFQPGHEEEDWLAAEAQIGSL